MTDEPMYLISESELKTLTHYNWMEYWDRVRARGNGAQQQAPAEELVRAFTKGHVAGAAAERERVIDEISLAIESKKDYGGNKETLFHFTGLRCIIDSFRSQPEKQQEGERK